jgi:hypothetical protein
VDLLASNPRAEDCNPASFLGIATSAIDAEIAT